MKGERPMKKFVSLLLALLLAAAAPLTVFAEDSEMMKPFEGLVTEVFEGGFLMEDTEMGILQINVDDNTILDGLLTIEPIAVGMYVIVDHNGMMTRSIPPQVYGVRVGCYTLNGVAGEITPEGVLLTGDPIFGDVFVQMTPTMANVFPGVPMLVYYDGVITMSLPGKVNARYVLVPEVTGVVSEKDGAGFTLTDAEGNTYRILTSDSLLVGQLAMNEEEPLPGAEEADALVAEEGAEVSAEAVPEETVPEDASAETEEAGEEAAVEEPAEAETTGAEAATEEAADEPAAQETANPDVLQDVTIATGNGAEAAVPSAVRWGDGDTVTVYHQGPLKVEAGMDLLALGLLVQR